MWPLLKRDGLGVQYVALLLLWNRMMGYSPFRGRPTSFVQLLAAVRTPPPFLPLICLTPWSAPGRLSRRARAACC
jgi:hypothetical protein